MQLPRVTVQSSPRARGHRRTHHHDDYDSPPRLTVTPWSRSRPGGHGTSIFFSFSESPRHELAGCSQVRVHSATHGDHGEGANGVEGGAGRRRGASDTGIPLAILTCLWCIGLPRTSVLSRGLTLHHSCSRRERAWERSTPTARAPCTVRRGRAMCRRCRLFAVPCEPTCAPSSAHYDAHLCAALIGDQSGRVVCGAA